MQVPATTSGKPNELIAYLHEFYPGCAQWLAVALKSANKANPVVEAWREQQLVKFIHFLRLTALDLERAFLEKRITVLAWSARNLLELSIWIDFCNKSDANAKQFRDDSARDLMGITNAMQTRVITDVGAEHPGLKKAQADLVDFAKTAWNSNALDDFEKVANAAKDLGREKQYFPLNKVFSKLAHPTAWAINSVESLDADSPFREIFLEEGVELSTDSLTSIRTFIVGKFPVIATEANTSGP